MTFAVNNNLFGKHNGIKIMDYNIQKQINKQQIVRNKFQENKKNGILVSIRKRWDIFLYQLNQIQIYLNFREIQMQYLPIYAIDQVILFSTALSLTSIYLCSISQYLFLLTTSINFYALNQMPSSICTIFNIILILFLYIFLSQFSISPLLDSYIQKSLQMIQTNNSNHIGNKKINRKINIMLDDKYQKYPIIFVEAPQSGLSLLSSGKLKKKQVFYYPINQIIKYPNHIQNGSIRNKILNFTYYKGLEFKMPNLLDFLLHKKLDIQLYKKYLYRKSQKERVVIIMDGINILKKRDVIELVKLSLMISKRNIYVILISYSNESLEVISNYYLRHYGYKFRVMINLIKIKQNR